MKKNIFRLYSHSRAYLVLIISISCIVQLNAQLVLRITNLPENTPETANYFFASNINGWNPGDANYRFNTLDDIPELSITAQSGRIEFKITRGDWPSVEGNKNGQFRPNRVIDYTQGTIDTIEIIIESWEDLEVSNNSSTANQQVMILDSAMYMPTLDRYRRIWVCLPVDYESDTLSYPVLYMHDGQNLFDTRTSFAGEWRIDETLEELENEGIQGAIIVGIDNGGEHRINEYSPFVNAQYGGGEGDAYLDFIIQELKPRIDLNFRTLNGPEFTGVMGSSMGGFISHYAHFRNPDIFGKAGLFSPAFWFSDAIFDFTETSERTSASKIYMIAGSEENAISEASTEMNELLRSMGFTDGDLFFNIVQGQGHNESFWASEFKSAYLWLFSDELSNSNFESTNLSDIKVYPNPAQDYVILDCKDSFKLSIYDNKAKRVASYNHVTPGMRIDLPGIEGHVLFLQFDRDNVSRIIRVIVP